MRKTQIQSRKKPSALCVFITPHSFSVSTSVITYDLKVTLKPGVTKNL